MIRGKKADASDGIIILVMIFFLAVSFIVAAFVNSKISTIISTTALNQSDSAAKIVQSVDKVTTNGIQQGFVMMFVFMVIGTILSSFLVRVHPAFFFLYLIFAAVTVILGAILGNVYSNFINNATMAEVAAQQPQINWIMSHIVVIMISTIAISVLVLFAKPPEFGGGGGMPV